MQTYYLGKEWNGSDFTEYFFQKKKNENLLIERNKNKSRRVFQLIEDIKGNLTTVEVKRDIKYENLEEDIIMSIDRIKVLNHIKKKLNPIKGKTYFSKSKGEVIEISKMNTVHIMNSVVKKARDYFDNLKLEKETTFKQFQTKLEGWTDDVEIKDLVEELVSRNF